MRDIDFDIGSDLLGNYQIEFELDIVRIRQIVKQYAKQINLGIVDQTRITTAVSELFRNMLDYAGGGKVILHKGFINKRNTIVVTCIDYGPGINDLELAMSDGYTTGQGMGLGLPGAKRLVDRFEIESEKGKGTTVRVMKWK